MKSSIKKFITSIILLITFSLSAQHRPEIHCKHFFYGYPYGTPLTNDLIIRDIYALSNNDSTKLADWVAYCLTPREVLGDLTIHRTWKADPWLDEHETLEPSPDDYEGANRLLNVDRGHQAPLASFKGSVNASHTNFLSNITPQKSELNQGPWMHLEAKVRDLVLQCNIVYIMTGPLYETSMPSIPNSHETHAIPSGYWKIICTENHDSINVASFIFDQQTSRNSKIQNHLVTINEIEQRSKLDFLWHLNDSIENCLENKIDTTFTQTYFNN